MIKPRQVMEFLREEVEGSSSEEKKEEEKTSSSSAPASTSMIKTMIKTTGERLTRESPNVRALLKRVVSKFFDNELEVELAAITAIQRIQLSKNDSSTLRYQEVRFYS